MRIVCIGDSLTYGEGIESPYKWTDIVASSLPRHEVIAKGVCGDTTRLGLERFPRDVQELRPDILIVQFGLNDANRWESDGGHLPRVSPEAFRANLVEMHRRARAFGAVRTGILDLTPTTKDSVLPQWWRFRGSLRSACEQCGAKVIKHTIPDIAGSYLQEDGVHLSPRGNEAIANAVIDFVMAQVASIEAVAA